MHKVINKVRKERIMSVKHPKRQKKALEGEGIVDDIKDGFKTIVNKFSKRVGFNNISTKTLQQLGNFPIVKCELYRKPIHSFLDSFINTISFNAFSELKAKYGFDKMFHLALVYTVRGADGIQRKVIVEKIDAVTITTAFNTGNDTEVLDVPLSIPGLTVNKVLQNARNKIDNDSLFFDYNAWNNNCQVFCKNLLQYSGMLTPYANQFLFQDVSRIAEGMPSIAKAVMQVATDAGQIANHVLGKGKVTSSSWQDILQDMNKDDEMRGGGLIDWINKYLYNSLTSHFKKGIQKGIEQENERLKQKSQSAAYSGYGVKTKAMADKNNVVRTGPSIGDKLRQSENDANVKRLDAAKEQRKKTDEKYLESARSNLYLTDDILAQKVIPKSKAELKVLKSLYNKKPEVKANKAYESTLTPEELKYYRDQQLNERKFKFDKQEAKKIELQEAKIDREESKVDRNESKIDRNESKIDREESRVERNAASNERLRIARKEQQEKDDKLDKYYVETHQIYKIKNAKLRDSLDRQYKDMYNKMIREPRKYGSIGLKSFRSSDQATIDAVYKNYGKPEKTWDTVINDGLIDLTKKAVGYIPGVGTYAQKGLNAVLDATNDAPAEAVPLDYNEFEGSGWRSILKRMDKKGSGKKIVKSKPRKVHQY